MDANDEERTLLVASSMESVKIQPMSRHTASSSGLVAASTFDVVDGLGSGAGARDTPAQILKYNELLIRANEEDLSSVADTTCIYHGGYDKQGRAVIVFIGKWFKQSQFTLEKALLYLLKTVEPVSDHDYIVLYFHTRTSNENIPSYWWIREVYNTLTYKYKKNLKAFYIVHPTLWTKVTCWWFATFMAPAIKNKIHNIHAVQDLEPVVDLRSLSLPMFIMEQDMVFNGIRPYRP